MYSRDDAIKTTADFVGLLKKGGVRVAYAFLFGSYAHGCANENSDIDVAVVSPDFTGFRFDDLGKVARFILKANPDIEVHTFAESRFNSDDPFAVEIKRNGVPIV